MTRKYPKELQSLLGTYIESDPRLGIWNRYPDVSDADDAYTDTWACEQVSSEFTAFARSHGWDAEWIRGADPENPLAFDHSWVRLTRDAFVVDVDWTARQFHNLNVVYGYDSDVLSLPWPLVWDPSVAGPDTHPIAGRFASASSFASKEPA